MLRLVFRRWGPLVSVVAAGCVGTVDVPDHTRAAAKDGGVEGGGFRESSTTGVSPELACSRYSRAFCDRARQCIPEDPVAWPECVRSALDCPDILFSPGSTRTVENALACAEVIATWSCSDWNAGRLPDCVNVGTRPNGESCAYNSQCASGWCDAFVSQCGACTPMPTRSVDAGSGALGDAASRPPPGKPCAEGACATNAFCGTGNVCVALPKRGEPCAFDDLDNPYCAADSRCLSGRCVALGSIGDACEPKDHGWNIQCGDASTCECAVGDCTHYVCTPVRLAGETCDAESKCLGGMGCVDGVCRSTEPPHTFEALCDKG